MKRLWVLLVLLSLGALSVAHAQDDASPVEAVIAAWNTGETDALAELISPDVVVNLPPSLGVQPPFSGLEGYGMNLGGWRAGLPDLNLELVTLIEGEDAAAARVLLTGTHTADFFGIPPTDAELAFAVNIIYEFDEAGMIVAEWWEWDTTLELVQLGLFTPPPAAS